MREKRFPKLFQMKIDSKLEQRLEIISVKAGLGKASLARLALRSGLNSISRNLAAPAFEDKEAHRD